MSEIAVVDVETTGLFPFRHDPVVEVAAVVLSSDGDIIREFTSLVNPERDIGPTHIHQITSSDILSAPKFSEIAGVLLEVIDGCVALAGHNVRFDQSFLAVEFERMEHKFPKGPALCTLSLSGGGDLKSCCDYFKVPFRGEAHAALNDARATALLLSHLLSEEPQIQTEIQQAQPIAWPTVPKSSVVPLTRSESQQSQSQTPTYLQRLLARVHDGDNLDVKDPDSLAYLDILDRSLEDRHIDEIEGDALFEIATLWGIDGNRVIEIHRHYLSCLVDAALADGVVTDSERRDLSLVSHLLGIDFEELDELLNGTGSNGSAIGEQSHPEISKLQREPLTGKNVCFTGDLQCRIDGEPITKSMATDIATQFGINVAKSVTKKLDILVVADPHTQSRKAEKARRYGIRIMHEPVFWKSIGAEVE